MKSAEPVALRRLSHIENFSSTRHHLGIYRCVTVTCRYHPPSTYDESTVSASLLAAVGRVVASQPMLRVGIVDQHTSHDARFTHVARIDLRQHVGDWRPSCQLDASPARYEEVLAERQAWHHDQLWEDIETRPPWRIEIIRPVASGSDISESDAGAASFYDALFAFHHALMDGSSGKAFHQLLLAQLTSPSGDPLPPSFPVLNFPEPPILPEAQEDVIPFTNSIPYLATNVLRDLGPAFLRPWLSPPTPWHGKAIDFSLPYRTRALPADIPGPVVVSLLAGCRSQAASLTALIHALVLTVLAARAGADDEVPFAASTPISLRPYMCPKSSDPALRHVLRNLVTGHTHRFDAAEAATLGAAAAAESPGDDGDDEDGGLNALIWETARRVKRDLAARLATLPADDVGGLAQFVGDWMRFHRAKDGRPRAESWEVSNIGVLVGAGEGDGVGPKGRSGDNGSKRGESDVQGKDNDNQGKHHAWSISRIFFTNGSMVAGPPLGVNVASVRDGTLTAALSWQDTVIPEELAKQLAKDLQTLTDTYHQTGKFSLR